MSLEERIKDLLSRGFIKIVAKACVGCKVVIPDEVFWFLLTKWLHLTHCRFCGQPVKIRIKFRHDEANGYQCWNFDSMYVDAQEVQQGQNVCVVHDKCWIKACKPGNRV